MLKFYIKFNNVYNITYTANNEHMMEYLIKYYPSLELCCINILANLGSDHVMDNRRLGESD